MGWTGGSRMHLMSGGVSVGRNVHLRACNVATGSPANAGRAPDSGGGIPSHICPR